MMSLFASFDLGVQLWIYIPILILFYTFQSVNLQNNLLGTLTKITSIYMSTFFSSIKSSPSKFTSQMILSIMFICLILNFSSVMGFIFPLTSQVSIVLYMGLTLWICFMIFKLAFNIKGFIYHCTPEGSPALLTIFLFIIELVSNIIRPLTMSIRLVANILAGHLLMILLSELVLAKFTASPAYVALNAIEMCVAMIQAYIFVTMTWLYYSEV